MPLDNLLSSQFLLAVLLGVASATVAEVLMKYYRPMLTIKNLEYRISKEFLNDDKYELLIELLCKSNYISEKDHFETDKNNYSRLIQIKPHYKPSSKKIINLYVYDDLLKEEGNKIIFNSKFNKNWLELKNNCKLSTPCIK